VDDRVNEESIIWHTGLDVVIDVNIEVGTSWSLADRLTSIADLWQSARAWLRCGGIRCHCSGRAGDGTSVKKTYRRSEERLPA
jgi:hypothetical protein